MQKQTLKTIAWLDGIVLSLCLAAARQYPDNPIVKTVVPIVGLTAFVVLVAAAIAMNVRGRQDAPPTPGTPQLLPFRTVLKRALLYIIVPGVIAAVIVFAIAFFVGWRPEA